MDKEKFNELTNETIFMILEESESNIENSGKDENLIDDEFENEDVVESKEETVNQAQNTNNKVEDNNLIDDDEEELLQTEEVEQTEEVAVAPVATKTNAKEKAPKKKILNLSNSEKTEKKKADTPAEKGDKSKKSIKGPLIVIGIGIVFFMLVISVLSMFLDEEEPKQINEISPVVAEQTVNEEYDNVQAQAVPPVSQVDSNDLAKRKQQYKQEQQEQELESPLPKINKSEPNNSIKVVKQKEVTFKEKSTSGKKYTLLNNGNNPNDSESVTNQNSYNQVEQISNQNTQGSYENIEEIVAAKDEEIKQLANSAQEEIDRLQKEAEKLKAEKSQREIELEKQLEEFEKIKAEQAKNETLNYKSKTNDVAINIFVLNSNMAFLGGKLYTEQTVKINKRVYTASFNDMEGKYYNISGTENYVSVKQLEDNYELVQQQ